MSIATVLATSVLAITLGCDAQASANVPPAQPPSADDITTGRSVDVHKLLADVHDARSELASGAADPARRRVAEALAIAGRIGTRHRYALVEENAGTIEELSSSSSAGFVKQFERYTEQELLDLRAARLELDYARISLADNHPAEAGRRLARIDQALRMMQIVTPDREALVTENLTRALHDAQGGDWRDASTAFRVARSDAARSPGVPHTTFSVVPAGW